MFRMTFHARVLLAYALALSIICTLQHHVAWGQQCEGYTRLQFHNNAEREGMLSYITAPNQTVYYTDGKKFSIPVVINVISPDILDPLSDIGGTQLDTRLDGLAITVSPKPDLNVRLGGQVANIVRGRCIFKDLSISDSPLGMTIVLAFRLTLPNGTVLSLETGAVSPVGVTEQALPDSLRFANFGFIIRENQPLSMPLVRGGSALSPLIRLEPLTRSGVKLIAKAYTVRASCTSGTLNPNLWLFNTQELDVALNLENADPTTSPICSFNVSLSIGGWARTVATGPITLVALKQRSRFMFFEKDTSFIKHNNYGGSGFVAAAIGVPLPPVVIKLYTTNFEFDASNTGLVITAHSIQAELLGAEAVVQRGVATFSQLRFVGDIVDKAVITFVAGPQGRLPVAGSVLYSGPVDVAITTTKKTQLGTSPLSGIQAGQSMSIKLQGRTFVLPPIVVVVKDSAGQFDSTANNMLLSIQLVPTVATVPNPEQRVENGLAAWSNLQLQANSKLQFSVRVSDDNNQLTTGTITVEPELYTEPIEATAFFYKCTDPVPPGTLVPDCIFKLKFASEYASYSSHVYEENMPIFTTVGGRIPTIRVELHDMFGVTSDRTGLSAGAKDRNVPAVFAMTGLDPRNEELLVRGGARDQDTGGRNEGIYKNGVYEFSCLEFASVPTGLIRLTFAAYNISAEGKILNKLEGINVLRSGFVSVTPTAVPSYSLRFDKADSLIVYEGQISTGAANIALPTITLVIVDSNNEPVPSAQGMVIAAEPTSGEIDKNGAREVVTGGKAKFTNIKFTDTGNDPKLVFRVFQTTEPAQGKSVSTGVFVLAALPIPYFEIAFASTRGEFSDVTYQFQELTFATYAVAHFKVSIYVRDSAHQVHSSAGGNVIKIESTSAAQIENRAGSTIVQLDPICNCANFTTAIGRPSPATGIYVTYTVTEGPSLLKGKKLVVGPIIIEEELRKVSTCEARLITPLIMGEFRLSTNEFATKSAKIGQAIATKLGLESSRVTILPEVKEIKRRDFSTGGEWTGTLAKIIFSNPFPTSTNLRTSSQLAEEFVRLRPQCDATASGGGSSSSSSTSTSSTSKTSTTSSAAASMQSAYFATDIKTCDINAFRASLEAAKKCAADLLIPMCQCYDEGPAGVWGLPCLEDSNPELLPLLTELCLATVDCAEASITATCAGLVSALTTNLGWLYALLATATAIVMIVMVMRKKGVTIGRTKIRLNFYDKFRGHRVDPYEVEGAGKNSQNLRDEDDD